MVRAISNINTCKGVSGLKAALKNELKVLVDENLT